MNTQNTESTGGLISDAMTHVSSLVRKEVDLARAEIDQNLNRAGTAIGLLIASVVVALTALHVLTAALVAGLAATGLGTGWAALIVGGVLAIIAYAMINKGTNDLKLSSIAPTRTVENIKRDADAVKGDHNA